MRVLVAGCVVVAVLGSAGAARADNKELIVGTWEITYCDAKDIPVGTILKFNDNGKLQLTIKVDGKEVTVDAGGYKVEKDVVILTGKDGDKNDKGRICLLNKSSLVINDEIEDKLMVMKRKK